MDDLAYLVDKAKDALNLNVGYRRGVEREIGAVVVNERENGCGEGHGRASGVNRRSSARSPRMPLLTER